jgi:hypothetical protein
LSLSYTCDVHCDKCAQWMHGATAAKPSGLATIALKLAKKAGWSRYTQSTYTDLCPECLEKERKA